MQIIKMIANQIALLRKSIAQTINRFFMLVMFDLILKYFLPHRHISFELHMSAIV